MSSLRIIGGKWRGRKISFYDKANVRPSPSRVRETLFNWLQSEIRGARCLELYAGSGILSAEALSRGADQVTLVEKSKLIYQYLTSTFSALPCSNYELVSDTAAKFLKQDHAAYDIIFIDPPFDSGELKKILAQLLNLGVIHMRSIIYVESNKPLELPKFLYIHRQGRAGRVYYYLLKTQTPSLSSESDSPLDFCKQ